MKLIGLAAFLRAFLQPNRDFGPTFGSKTRVLRDFSRLGGLKKGPKWAGKASQKASGIEVGLGGPPGGRFGRPREAPRGSQERPKSPRRAPGAPQDGHKELQEGQSEPQEGPREP